MTDRSAEDGITLFERTVRVTAKNFLIQNKLGNALFQKGEIGKAMIHYQEALRINPDFAEAYNNIGNALLYGGDIQRAIVYYTKALSQAPDYADATTTWDSPWLARERSRRPSSIILRPCGKGLISRRPISPEVSPI
ncbi:MAG: tetratricopeptide repeat protein [Thermodesulfobacteriota bacterium]